MREEEEDKLNQNPLNRPDEIESNKSNNEISVGYSQKKNSETLINLKP